MNVISNCFRNFQRTSRDTMNLSTELTDPSDVTMTSSISTITSKPPLTSYIVETVTLSVMWPMALFGNALVCVVVHRSRRLQSTTNYFVVSLSATDLAMALLCMPFILGRVISGQWMFGTLMCKMIRFVQYLLPGCTMFVSLSASVDRFYTIIYPLSFKFTRHRTEQFVFLSAIVALVLASPCFYLYDIKYADDDVEWCQTYVEPTWGGIFYVGFMFIVVWILPVCVMLVVYIKIFKYIWRSGIGGRTFQRTFNPVPRPKVKIVKMIMVVTLMTVCLILPFFVVQLWYCSRGGHDVNQSIYIGVVWTYFTSAVAKPTMYICYNSNFRRGCKEVFCMSTMKCYRGNAYTITTASKLSRKNYVGVAETVTSTDVVTTRSPSRTFNRSAALDKYSWPLANSMPSTYL